MYFVRLFSLIILLKYERKINQLGKLYLFIFFGAGGWKEKCVDGHTLHTWQVIWIKSKYRQQLMYVRQEDLCEYITKKQPEHERQSATVQVQVIAKFQMLISIAKLSRFVDINWKGVIYIFVRQSKKSCLKSHLHALMFLQENTLSVSNFCFIKRRVSSVRPAMIH